MPATKPIQLESRDPVEIQPGETDRFTHPLSGFNSFLYPFHSATYGFQQTTFTAWARAFRWWETCFDAEPLGAPLPYQTLTRDILAANREICELMAKDYGKPSFEIEEVVIDGESVKVTERVVAQSPFCNLLHFKRKVKRNDPKVLIVAPLSGHFATLLRPTVKRMLEEHDVYITDWNSARDVPLEAGDFGVDHYVSHVKQFLEVVGPEASVLAVCQPVVPVLAAVSLLAQEESPHQPVAMVLMGGPVDTEAATSEVTELAEGNEIEFFENNLIGVVPPGFPGAGRKVFPGFVALGSFLAMNPGRHVMSYMQIWNDRIQGRHAAADKKVRFYDEYNAVLDNYGRFYLETVQEVFKDEDLAKGKMRHFGYLIEPALIKKTALMTVEGARDDISPPGQTTAAHILCSGLKPEQKFHYLEEEAGHYGIFSGRKWRNKVAPRITTFLRQVAEQRGLSYQPSTSQAEIATYCLSPEVSPK